MKLTIQAITICVVAFVAFERPSAAEQPTPAPPAEAAKAQPVEAASPQSGGGARFRLYRTQNLWTLLMLDTRIGWIWQVQYSVDAKTERAVLPLSLVSLADGPDDRSELVATQNMWNFILLDRIEGQAWQCQFAMEAKGRGCIKIPFKVL